MKENKYEKLFDPKFVHFMWSDELEGKEGFFSEDITCLKIVVTQNSARDVLEKSTNDEHPFLASTGCCFRFFYYDPNYNVKRAYLDGKIIEYYYEHEKKWYPIEPRQLTELDDGCEYRIKPEEEKCCVFKGLADSLLIVNEGTAEYKTHEHLFEGTKEECQKWIDVEQNCKRCLYEDSPCTIDDYGMTDGKCLSFYAKPEPKKEPTYRPFTDTDELVGFWEDNYGNKYRPEGTMPLIWVMQGTRKSLITDFDNRIVRITKKWYEVSQLLGDFTFLDGKPCGVKISAEGATE